ncbi:MAG: hypothetical protein ACFB0D_18500 [Phormidesmis sp.]
MPAIFPLFAILVVFVFISLHASANQKPKRRRSSDFRRSSGGDYGRSSGKDYARGSGRNSRRDSSERSAYGKRDSRGSSRDRY